jgi:hypothetical protein
MGVGNGWVWGRPRRCVCVGGEGGENVCVALVAGRWALGAGCWLLAAGCWPLAAGCWLLGVGCWLLAGEECYMLLVGAACCLGGPSAPL